MDDVTTGFIGRDAAFLDGITFDSEAVGVFGIPTTAGINEYWDFLRANLMVPSSPLLLVPIAVLTVLLGLDLLGNKITHKAFHAFAFIAVMCATAGIIFIYQPPMGTAAAAYFALALVMTAVVAIMGFVCFKFLDYVVMYACFLCLVRFIGLWYSGMHAGFIVSTLFIFYVFAVILAVYKIRTGRLGGQLFHCWFTVVLVVSEGYIADFLFGHYITRIGYMFGSSMEKLLIWGAATLAVILFNCGLIFLVKRLFGKHFKEINEMGRAYPRIERYFIYNSAVILLFVAVYYFFIHYLNNPANQTLYVPSAAYNLFLILAQAIQLSYLILLYKLTWLKDNLRNKTLENQTLAEYSASLKKNVDDIKGIKHDIRNILVTMGRFVAQSGDTDMGSFFREKISPYINEEISKNDLFAKLSAIGDEPLKAFLWYKTSQAVERGITVELDVAPDFSASDTRLEPIDLVRILGILLDNATEECMTLPQSAISIKFTLNAEMVSYTIKNTVSQMKKITGIQAGISSKEDGRGKGLKIVRDIIGKYDCLALNSYFSEDCFAQNLIVYRFSAK